ncbi:MAG: polysulfide reductase NrfD [Planctomycetes bacterium]|nr:polysulfide reductase NrfD [Planctomycetota bacterium]
MQYGFLIDHRKCIGCHACTVACKSENNVPVGNFRTWVKYTEKGTFPAIKRHFSVLRCNHCTKAPCVTICPVNALEKRKDGIVDIDRDACIGCRACMQACPYDAIYLNEDLGAVEKCHYCAHRIEKNLEPACVVVCPEEAIVSGDLHDPLSKIAQLVASQPTLVRRPEQNTGPNTRYLGVLPDALEPGVAERPATYMWSERPASKPEPWPDSVAPREDTRTVLDVGHKVEWGWQVAAYLVTKGVAAGAALLAPFAGALGLESAARDFAPEIFALVFLGLTTFLLVEDLKRPMKFLTLLTRPNTKSWLVRGAWILMTFGATVSAALVARVFASMSGLPSGLEDVPWATIADSLRWVNAVLALGVAGYTAFLFQQCEGRDLWQEKSLLPHLLVQAVLCGTAVLMPFTGKSSELSLWFGVAMTMHGLFLILESKRHHKTDNARQAAAFLPIARMGSFRHPYRFGSKILVALPAAFIAIGNLGRFHAVQPSLFLLGGVTALLGLFLYKYAYIRAAQLPPLS